MKHEDGYEDQWEEVLGTTHQQYLDIIECAGTEIKKLMAEKEREVVKPLFPEVTYGTDASPILNDEEHASRSARLLHLTLKGDMLTADEVDRMLVLITVIETYEKKRWPIDPPVPPRQRIADAYYAAKAHIKQTWAEWYNYVAITAICTWLQVKDSLKLLWIRSVRAVKYLWLWIRDYAIVLPVIIGIVICAALIEIVRSLVNATGKKKLKVNVTIEYNSKDTDDD